MERAIIIHGMLSKQEYYNSTTKDSPSNSHWLAWLQQQLCQHDILAQAPEMPRPFEPIYDTWRDQFEKLNPKEDTLLVGHSCGGGFIVRWLSENPEKIVGKVVLVAPWLDIEGSHAPMFEFTIKQTISLQSKNGIDVLYSTDDHQEIQLSIDKLRSSTNNLRYHEFMGYGHFTLGAMKTREFPELAKICLGQ